MCFIPDHGADLFERIKSLENRILHLESVSPEYIDTMVSENMSVHYSDMISMHNALHQNGP